jgi:hypothetical protein
MTATQAENSVKTLMDEVKAVVPQSGMRAFQTLVTMMTLAILEIRDDATAHDYGVAMETMMDSLTGEDPDAPAYAFKGEPRPESDDDRPLYQRLDAYAGNAGRQIRGCWDSLQLFQVLLPEELLSRFHAEVVKPFAVALGIPSETERLANPDAYPSVNDGSDLVKILTGETSTDVANVYKLDR